MFAADNPFLAQARLAVRVLRIVAEEATFALKDGTAINLFYRNHPRLSVDLDLAYLPIEPRDASLLAIAAALQRIARAVEANSPHVRVHTGGAADGKLVAQQDRTTVTIDVNPVLRGSVFGAACIDVQPQVEELFGDLTAHVLAFEDVYGGKLVAALDRQHPRDLFDVMLLLETEGITERLLDAFVVYLASHGRPMAEVLRSRNKDLRSNHGGRAFDSAVATIDILPEVVEAVGDRCTVILDSGVRRGSDIVKALALGAKMVLVGRATLYGTACGGQAGAARAIKILSDEMERAFGYVGARSVSEIGPHIFAHHVPGADSAAAPQAAYTTWQRTA